MSAVWISFSTHHYRNSSRSKNEELMSIRYIHIINLLLFVFWAGCSQNENKLSSSDDSIVVEFNLGDGHKPIYRVTHENEIILEASALGVVLDGIDFSEKMKLLEVSPVQAVEDKYTMLHGKQKVINYSAYQKIFHLEHKSGQQMDVIFQVSDESVAFKYHFPGISKKNHKITEEKTSFNFPEGARAWLQPLANVNTGFAQTNPSYEENYFIDITVGTPAPNEAGWAYPALYKVNESWLLLSEAGLTGSYAATRLQQDSEDGNYQIGFPQETEEFPAGALTPESELPWTSPWRIMAIGDLSTIVESTLGTDLANPAIDMDTSWIEPGRASWTWVKLKDDATNYDDQKRFIDYASEMGWEYTLVDANWDETIGYDRIQELVDYGEAKDVDILLWYNSSGSWNETVMSPKNVLLTKEDRVKEFSRIQEMGVKGVKVDFFAGDGQSMIQYYLDIFEDAAVHKILVNTHGSTLPRGWHRTYPHLMTMESVKGFEFITFEQENANRAPQHGTMLPFTRNVFSPMDFTPMSLTELFGGIERQTTSAYELATPILFTSGIQHYAETAKGMETIPERVQKFIKEIPVVWDETKFIDGYPGEFVIIARRAGDQWFIGGLNGVEENREVTMDLSFLSEELIGEMIYDGEDKFSFNYKTITLSGEQTETFEMKANGGFAILFEENNN